MKKKHFHFLKAFQLTGYEFKSFPVMGNFTVMVHHSGSVNTKLVMVSEASHTTGSRLFKTY